MKQSLILWLAIVFGCYANTLVAQGENNNWHFGKQNFIDFNQDPPQIQQSNILTIESCSAASDAAGNLLFYTIGSRIWDANGDEMPNSNGLLGNGPFFSGVPMGSSAAGVAIVPNPADAQQYYVFSGDAYEDGTNKLYYSLVDMTLNGGLGDVVAGVKNIELMSDMSEFLTTTLGSDCQSYWLITRSFSNGNMNAFKIDVDGINTTPVVSVHPGGANYGTMNFAPNGTTLALGGSPFYISTFNSVTGTIGDFIAIPLLGSTLEFSASGNKLYAYSNGEGLYQLDLSSLPDAAAVAASQEVIYSLDPMTDGFIIDMRRAPDGKIYTLRLNMMSAPYVSIGCVQNPELSGAASNFNPQAFPTSSWWGNQIFTSFGEPMCIAGSIDTIINSRKDTAICSEVAAVLSSSLPQGSSYLWSTGATSSEIEVYDDGLYWVIAKDGCSSTIDSFMVQFHHLSLDLGADTQLCVGDTLVLNALQNNPAATYEWNNGSQESTLKVYVAGTYSVSIKDGDCFYTDSITVDVIYPEFGIVEGDTSLCDDIVLQLHAEGNMAGTYLWNTGEITPAIYTIPGQTGYYSATMTNICGVYRDSVYIEALNCQCIPFVPNAFTPNGDGRNDVFSINLSCPVMSAFSMEIFNRFGQRVFIASDPESGWDGSYLGGRADVGVYFYYITFKGRAGADFVFKGDLTLIR